MSRWSSVSGLIDGSPSGAESGAATDAAGTGGGPASKVEQAGRARTRRSQMRIGQPCPVIMAQLGCRAASVEIAVLLVTTAPCRAICRDSSHGSTCAPLRPDAAHHQRWNRMGTCVNWYRLMRQPEVYAMPVFGISALLRIVRMQPRPQRSELRRRFVPRKGGYEVTSLDVV